MWAATIDFTKTFDSMTHKSIWNALKSCGIEHDCISLLKKLNRDQKASVQTDEESNMFEIRKGTKQSDPLSSLLTNTVLQKALEDDIPRRQKKKGMGICLSDNDHDCLINMIYADDVAPVCILERTAPKMLCEFKRSTEKVGLRIHPGKAKILSNQSSDTRKEIEVDNIRAEILTLGEGAKYLGHDRHQRSNQGCLGDVPQVQTRADIEKLPAQTPTPAVRRSGNPDDVLRIRNMDTTKEHGRMIQSTQRKMLRLIKQTKRRDKKIVKRKDEINEEKDTNDLGSTGDESEDGQSLITHNDQDSGVSF